METQIFKRYPLYPEGAEVTEENKEEIAAWCGGTLKVTANGNSFFIQVPVMRPLSKRQSRANLGDHILKLGGGFKVYTPQGMAKSFRSSSVEERDADEDLAYANAIKQELAQEREKNHGSDNDS